MLWLLLLLLALACSALQRPHSKAYVPHPKAYAPRAIRPLTYVCCSVSELSERLQLHRERDVTVTEMSVFAEAVRQQRGTLLLVDLPIAAAAAAQTKTKTEPFDTSRASIAKEVKSLQAEVWLNLFRRNIALRNNKVLNPARNAQVIANLINILLYDGMGDALVDVTSYVGLTPDTYYTAGSRVLCVGKVYHYCAKRMLELPLEREAWIRGDRKGEEPDTPEERGEEGQDFRYTSVARSDLFFRVTDMVFAVSRLALRRAVAESAGVETSSYVLSFDAVDPVIEKAGYPVSEGGFRGRIEALLREDLRLLQPGARIELAGYI